MQELSIQPERTDLQQAGIWPLLRAAEARALDRTTIHELGIPGELLMECAGKAVAEQVEALLRPGGVVRVFCGSGNNGGDGYVAARHLHLRGLPVRIHPLADPAHLRGDAAANCRRAEAVGVPIVAASASGPAPPGSVWVDALFGTGLARPVEGAAAEAIQCMDRARSKARVVAVDLPSGLDADTGQPLGTAVRADLTVTLGLPKLGLTLEPGRSLAGCIRVARIGLVDRAPGVRVRTQLWTRAAVARGLPARPAAGHKGSFGHVLVVAGSRGKTGAAVLAARGAARVGAGLVTLACPYSTNPVLEAACIETMTAPLPETGAHTLGLAAQTAIEELAESRDVLVMGPGMGRVEETWELVRRLALPLARPLVLDADALLAFRESPKVLRERPGATLLTPHPGEAALLLATDAAGVNADRAGAAEALAETTGAVVVLKGAATLIAEPSGGRCVVNPTGGPLLASGGTGDVLAGMVGGLLAQGLPPLEAGVVGVWVHGAAADRLAEERGSAGTLAGEVADAVPGILGSLRSGPRGPSIGGGDVLAFPEPS